MEEKKSHKRFNRSKARVSVPLSEEVYKWCADQAEKYGISLPTYIAYIIGDSLNKK